MLARNESGERSGGRSDSFMAGRPAFGEGVHYQFEYLATGMPRRRANRYAAPFQLFKMWKFKARDWDAQSLRGFPGCEGVQSPIHTCISHVCISNRNCCTYSGQRTPYM